MYSSSARRTPTQVRSYFQWQYVRKHVRNLTGDLLLHTPSPTRVRTYGRIPTNEFTLVTYLRTYSKSSSYYGLTYVRTYVLPFLLLPTYVRQPARAMLAKVGIEATPHGFLGLPAWRSPCDVDIEELLRRRTIRVTVPEAVFEEPEDAGRVPTHTY